MRLSKHLTNTTLFSSVAFLAFGNAAVAQTVVEVLLWDKGEASMEMMADVMPMGMAMAGADMTMASMGITANLVEIPAGEVKFEVINESQSFYHSFEISLVSDPAAQLPYLDDMMMVDEEAAGRLAQVELRPRGTGIVTVDLEPGTYILFCNVAGHYMMGMWTLITVTG